MTERDIAQIDIEFYKDDMVGRKYLHFKGNVYQVDSIGIHSEDATPMVVYHSIKEPNKTWIRPLYMFISDVDRDKYPDVKQKKRFEIIVE